MIATRRCTSALIAAFILLGFIPRAWAQETLYRPELTAKYIEASLKTDWYGIYLQNKKIGYARLERKREDGKIIDAQLMSFKLASMGAKVELGLKQTLLFQSTAPYRMIGAATIETGGGTEKTTTFTWKSGDEYDSVHEVAGQKRSERIKGIDYTLADASATEIWIQQSPKVGAMIRARSFEPSDGKTDVETSKVIASKESLVSGVSVRFYEIETESKLRPIRWVGRYDARGTALSVVAAGVFELRRETEAEAKNTEYSQDLYVLGMAKIDKALGPTKQLRELVIELDGKGGAVFEEGPRQSVENAGNGTRRLRLGKRYGKEQKATAEEIKEALAETNSYPISQPKIKALADKATAGAKNDEEKVAKLVAFVHGYVDPHLAANAPNIHDLLVQKRGDCKSYALLFTNLARAAGVPAREVAGLLYAGDDIKAFSGHAWNEVVLGGVWVPVDAAWNETEIDAGHICFGADHKGESHMMNSLGRLSFRLVEVKRAP